MQLERTTGLQILEVVTDLARLRIAVFREFPYLYEGSLEYESHYLHEYARGKDNLVVVARVGGTIVGASSGMPLALEAEEVQRPFQAAGYNLGRIFYFGESVLLPEYRGRGLGVRFFTEREAHALERGFSLATFCAVERPEDHPRRPADHTPLDTFWTKRGYQKRPDLSTEFVWQDLDERAPSKKPMVFWTKELGL